MNKKPEQEILMREIFNIQKSSGDTREAEVRLKRRGTFFYVEKSGMHGTYALHISRYDDIEPAYQEYQQIVNTFTTDGVQE